MHYPLARTILLLDEVEQNTVICQWRADQLLLPQPLALANTIKFRK